VRLRFDLGHVLGHLGDDAEVAKVLESAVAEAPAHPMARSARFTLAVAYARLGRPLDEIATYGAVLRVETDQESRAMAFSNRGEARMLVGQYAEAIDDYRAAQELFPSDPMIHWGLGVALDRTGDPAGAEAEIKAAIALDPLDERLGSSEVFFVPPYDRLFYDGLGAMVRAANADEPPTSILWWELAAAKWSEYVEIAGPAEHWYPLARAHRAECERQLRKARQRARASRK
jgi:tetratricopeptide (TPR) repeat protein